MYRTADNTEDLVVEEEILSYDSVIGLATQERAEMSIRFPYNCDKDYVITVNEKGEQLEEIKSMLSQFGMTAYVELDEKLEVLL